MNATSLAICSALVALAAPAIALSGLLNHQLNAGVVIGIILLGVSWRLAVRAEKAALKDIERGNMCKISLLA